MNYLKLWKKNLGFSKTDTTGGKVSGRCVDWKAPGPGPFFVRLLG